MAGPESEEEAISTEIVEAEGEKVPFGETPLGKGLVRWGKRFVVGSVIYAGYIGMILRYWNDTAQKWQWNIPKPTRRYG
eukprot:g35345.t1